MSLVRKIWSHPPPESLLLGLGSNSHQHIEKHGNKVVFQSCIFVGKEGRKIKSFSLLICPDKSSVAGQAWPFCWLTKDNKAEWLEEAREGREEGITSLVSRQLRNATFNGGESTRLLMRSWRNNDRRTMVVGCKDKTNHTTITSPCPKHTDRQRAKQTRTPPWGLTQKAGGGGCIRLRAGGPQRCHRRLNQRCWVSHGNQNVSVIQTHEAGRAVGRWVGGGVAWPSVP